MQLEHDWLMQQGDDRSLLAMVGNRLGLSKKRPKIVGIAVSGGGDSIALLHIYKRIAHKTGQSLRAVTVDHTLREGSAEEAAQVGAFCANLGVPHDVLTWDTWNGHGNMQAAARDARYALIADWAHTHDIDSIALGHTKDDSAETFLMRLARKAGIDGLSLMANQFERDGMMFERPLWLAKRNDLRAYLERNKVSWIDDPSNDDPAFERVRVRQARDTLNELGIDIDTLFSAGLKLREARDALLHYTHKEARDRVRVEGGDLLVPICPHPEIPKEIGRRLQSQGVRWVGNLAYPPRTQTMQDLQTGILDEGRQTVGGCIVTQEGDLLRIAREHNAVRNLRCQTDRIWDNRWQLSGPHAPDLQIAALGEAVKDCLDWRDAGLPRTSLLSSPAVWRGDTLIAAPLAGYNPDWTAQIVADFHSSLLTH